MGRGTYLGHGAPTQKVKNSWQGRGTDPPWVEKDRFPFRPAQRKIGLLPKDSTYLVPPGIVLIGINHTIICQPIGLYLSYGYRNIITCTGRNSPWTGVFRVQLSRRGDRVGHQLTFLPHHADVVNGACCTMYNKQDHLRRAVKGSFFVSIFVDKCRFYVDKCRFYLK